MQRVTGKHVSHRGVDDKFLGLAYNPDNGRIALFTKHGVFHIGWTNDPRDNTPTGEKLSVCSGSYREYSGSLEVTI